MEWMEGGWKGGEEIGEREREWWSAGVDEGGEEGSGG